MIIMRRGVKSRKAVSPMVSTALLIVIVIILAILILLWARGFIKEVISKEIAGNEKRVDEFCLEVKMSPIVNQDDSFGFENTGNVPIFAYKVKLEGGGKSEVVTISNEVGGAVNPGFSVIVDDPRIGAYSSYDSVKIIPTLLGKVGSDTREFECPEVNGLEV